MLGDDLFMDDRQRGIFQVLTEKRPDLGRMYRTALRMLSEDAEAGDERIRIAHICHSMREVMNRGVSAMGTFDSFPIKPSSETQVQGLPDLLSLHPELTLNMEGEFIPVPQEVAAVFDRLIMTAVQEKRRSRDRVAALLTDDGNNEHLIVKSWIDTREFFVKWAHLEDKERDLSELPSDDLIRSHIGLFDEILNGVITVFFARRHLIDDLLAEINALEEEGDDESVQGSTS